MSSSSAPASTPKSPKCSFTRVVCGKTTYHIGVENEGGTALSEAPQLTLPSNFAIRDPTIKSDSPPSPVVKFKKHVSGRTTFRVAEIGK